MAAPDDQRREDTVAILTALAAITTLVMTISRQVNDLKYIVFKKTFTKEEYDEMRKRQEEVFQKADDVIAKLKNIQELLSHG